MRTFWLNVHVAYACRHSGACCTSRWPIPIERDRAARVAQAIDDGRVRPLRDPWLRPAPNAPADVAGMLEVTDGGECVFFDADRRSSDSRLPPPDSRFPGRCRIHSARPRSCSHFPYVCLIDPRGVRVTLSHYCPTAAAMLVDHRGPVAIVEGPAVPVDRDIPEGLDARDVLPPLETPARLVGLADYSEWERTLLQSCARPDASLTASARDRFDAVRRAVPSPLAWPDPPDDFEQVWDAHVTANWPALAPILGRYLGARAFGSWVAYQGAGLPAVERSLELADAVFRVELARQAGRDGWFAPAQIVAALRQSDLLLVHYVDPVAFARVC